MQPRMVLKSVALILLTIVSLSANAEIDDATCGRIEKTFAKYEESLSCNEVSAKGIREYDANNYRPMCAGCNPRRQFFGDANNATNDSFDPSEFASETESPLKGLNRVPADLDLFQMVYPALTFANCKKEDFKSQYAKECSDFIKLGDIFYAGEIVETTSRNPNRKEETPDLSIGGYHQRKSREFYDQYMNSHSIVDTAIREAQTRGNSTLYTKACETQNKRHAENRQRYNEALGREKNAIWTNILNEMVIKRGCLALYVSEFPAHWCGGIGGKGQKVEEAACVKELSTKPEVVLEKFKKFASDPSTLVARYGQKVTRATNSTGIESIRNDAEKKYDSRKSDGLGAGTPPGDSQTGTRGN